MIDQLSSWEYLAHHIPAVFYDGIMRVLKAGGGAAAPDACTLAAQGLSQCVVSAKCSSALRPAGASKCRGCASDKTCTQYWGMPKGRCDRGSSEMSGWMCYDGVLPGTQLNLYLGSNGSPKDASQAPNLSFNLSSTLSSVTRSAGRLSRQNPLSPTPNSHRVGK
jgi:hypothetical protein